MNPRTQPSATAAILESLTREGVTLAERAAAAATCAPERAFADRVRVAALATLTLLASGCYARFDLPTCVELTESCGIVDGPEFCARVDAAIASDACHVEGEAMWRCAETIGCDFPLRCRDEYAALFACEP